MPDVVSQVTALVPTADQKSFQRLRRSRAKYCADLKLLVAGPTLQETPGVSWVAPKQGALPAGRLNALLARVRTPYCLVLDYNAYWRRRPKLAKMIEPLAASRAEIVTGVAVACRRRWLFFSRRTLRRDHGVFDFSGNTLTLRPATDVPVDGYIPCDFGANYFAARTDKLRQIGGWDDQLLLHEQVELFVRAARHRLRTVCCRETFIDIWNAPPPSETAVRSIAVGRMGVSRLLDLDGCETQAPALPLAA